MAYDKIYYFDKINHVRHELGEIQTNFNLNIVIDGDKDSMQIDVHSYSRGALQPNTIIYHASDPLQWFVVKKDNVKRNANEQGFYYIHSITLNGAIDLLKNRDLTDCGMNANGYTIDTFFKKLLKLSNFEFDYEIDYGNNVDKDKKVDYIKSYENYTLLSAIRDFLNGYNCDVKLGFTTTTQNGNVVINKAIFKIIPRTGNIDLTPIDIGEFDDIRESINFDKESYGTTVISNAQNVVSTLAKTYPQVGGVMPTGKSYESNYSNSVLKLPSTVWKVNWIKAIPNSRFYIYRVSGDEEVVLSTDSFFAGDEEGFEKVYNNLVNKVNESASSYIVGYRQTILTYLANNKELLKSYWIKWTTTFYNNPTYNPREGMYGTIIKENQNPYIAVLTADNGGVRDVATMDKESSNLTRGKVSLSWERGSNEIDISVLGETPYNSSTLEHSDCKDLGNPSFFIDGGSSLFIKLDYGTFTPTGTLKHYQHFRFGFTCFQVNYIPMSDLKVKQDNENNNNDIQLYNQNGKLNDSVALSKMVDSYSKEITNPTITRYGEYYNLNDIPQIGQIVMDGNTKYVINNISYNLYPCESDDEDEVNYYCECEFTLAEFISTKSIMTSPNTNVRDYGIPQKYNIKRRQVYRDYYEFDFNYEALANQETPYAKLENYLQLSDSATPKEFDHTALIKITYESQIGTPLSNTWYYQLNSTAYTMAKSVYEVIDFDDNNIIGYDVASCSTGFSMSNWWQYRAVTTPVQYVDDNGKFIGITLQMTGKNRLEEAYSQIDTNNNPVMFSAHCFIPQEIYDLVATPNVNTKSDLITEQGTMIRNTGGIGAYYEFSVNSEDIGIPNEIPLDQEHILGLTDTTITINEQSIDPTSVGVSFIITNIDNTNKTITIRLSYALGHYGDEVSLSTKVEYLYDISYADYVIDEPNYEKDPIEVPVFEYSLQIGDTKEVEVGDNILKNNVGMLSFYTAVVVNKNTATPLNASKWFEGLSVDGDTYSDPSGNYDCLVEIANPNYVNFALEDDNKKLRIKFFTNNITALFYGKKQTPESTKSEVFVLDSITKGTNPKPKSQLVDKDIIIYRHTIKSMTYDSSEDKSTCDYDTELMYIIHAPQDAQFENDDLVLKLNYYKLR